MRWRTALGQVVVAALSFLPTPLALGDGGERGEHRGGDSGRGAADAGGATTLLAAESPDVQPSGWVALGGYPAGDGAWDDARRTRAVTTGHARRTGGRRVEPSAHPPDEEPHSRARASCRPARARDDRNSSTRDRGRDRDRDRDGGRRHLWIRG